MNQLSIYLNTKEVNQAMSQYGMPALKQREDTRRMAIALYECAKAYNSHLMATNHSDQNNIKALVDVVKHISGNFLKARKHMTAEFMDCAEELLRADFCNEATAQLNNI